MTDIVKPSTPQKQASAWGTPKKWLAEENPHAYGVAVAAPSPAKSAAPPVDVVGAVHDVSVDADLALALRLQEEFDRDAALEQRRGRAVSVDPKAKVQAAFFGEHGAADDDDEYACREQQRARQLDRDAEAAEALAQQLDDEEAAAADEPTEFDILVGQSFNRARATGAAGAFNKHDAEVSMARNARQLVEKLHNCGDLAPNVRLTNAVYNRLNERAKNSERRRVRHKQTEDVAVVDRVLDQSTRLKILHLLNAGILSSIAGVVATGKESNVYYATGNNARVVNGKQQTNHSSTTDELAVKVFSLSSHGFQNRQKYMHGERRFGKNLSKSHVNKFIKLWAEKEMRNLARLRRVGVNCPRPVALREHVLVMSFVGAQGQAAPKLADVQLNARKYNALYHKCLLLMRTMYHDCGLVHSDLSEYNLLYDHGELVVIDLSHAIGSENENAATFLRDDCVNVTRFFARRGARTLTPRAAFEFVIDKQLLDDSAPLAAPSEVDKTLVALETTLLAEAAALAESASVASDSEDTASTTSNADESTNAAAVRIVLDDADVNQELVARAQRRAALASAALDALIDADGQVGVFDKRSLSAADAAFLEKHIPRSLHEVDETRVTIDEVNTFGLIAPKQQEDDFDSEDE